MAEKKKKTQAEKAASSAKAKSQKTAEKKTTSKENKSDKQSAENKIPGRVISSIIFLILFILFLIIFIIPEGVVVVAIGNFAHGLIGNVGFFVSIPIFLYLFIIHAFSGKRPVIMRTVSFLLFVLTCGCLHHLILAPQNLPSGIGIIGGLYSGGITGTAGGVICGGVAEILKLLCGRPISFIVLIIGALLAFLGGIQITIPSIIRAIRNRPRADWEDEEEEEPRQEPATVVVNHFANKRIERMEKKRSRKMNDQERASDIMRQIGSDVETPVAAAGVPVTAAEDEQEIISDSFPMDDLDFFEDDIEPEENVSAVQEPAEVIEVVREVVDDTKHKKVSAKEAAQSAFEVAEEIAQAESEEKPVYCFPPIDLLKAPGREYADGTAEMKENKDRLNETLASFKIEAHIINVTRGPSVTRYEVELEKGVRLNKLTSAADDIALSLGASGVRIAAVPGKISVVGIEVPNRAVTTVSLREVIDSAEFSKAKSMSSFAVGKDIGGNCIVGNIAKLPHMLIAGTTGSGKSVCMNSVIISLLYKASPDDVKLIMVDPKMVELGVYNGIPHLLIPVVTDPKKAAGSLQWAVSEMLRRYKAMSDAGVRDLESYNSIKNSQEGMKKLPQVVVIIDELADLMLVAAKEVEESICRIAQMGRAAGIHLIIATQRPSADVITGLMKANIPSRIAFAVASAMESRIILDTQGAEKLVGRGDMLYAPIGNGKPKRVQGCFVSDPEVEAVASYVKNNYVNAYDQQVMEEIEKKAAQTGNGKTTAADPEPTADELDGDEMLPAAVDVILETGQASVSMLQRRLKLGYARAARIVDEMEDKGIVGPFQGSKPRAILITKEQWETMKSGQSSQMDFDDLAEDDSGVPEDI